MSGSWNQDPALRARIMEELDNAQKALKRLDFDGAIVHLKQVTALEQDNTTAKRLLKQAELGLQIRRTVLLAVAAIVGLWLIYMLLIDWGPAVWNRVMAVYGPSPTPTATATFTPTPTWTPTATATSSPTPTWTATPTVTPTPTPTPILVRLSGSVAVHSAPESGSRLITYLSKGEIVRVHAIYAKWALISTEFVQGWVAMEYARPVAIPLDIVTPTTTPAHTVRSHTATPTPKP